MKILSRLRARDPQVPPVTLPEGLLALLPAGERVLGAVPVDEEGARWAVAGYRYLHLLGAGEPVLSIGWDEVSKGVWDAESRVFTLELVRRDDDPAQDESEPGAESQDAEGGAAPFRPQAGGDLEEVLVLEIPLSLRRTDEQGRSYAHAVEEEAFAQALRHRVEAALVHHVSQTLPGGVRATASVRRDAEGRLYTVTQPSPSRLGSQEDVAALKEIEVRVRDGVGLPTR